jgi:hypothetical protein
LKRSELAVLSTPTPDIVPQVASVAAWRAKIAIQPAAYPLTADPWDSSAAPELSEVSPASDGVPESTGQDSPYASRRAASSHHVPEGVPRPNRPTSLRARRAKSVKATSSGSCDFAPQQPRNVALRVFPAIAT